MKQDCPAGVKLCLSDDGQSLRVTEVKDEHNHEICKVSTDHLVPVTEHLAIVFLFPGNL